MKLVNELEQSHTKKVPALRPGDTVRVHTKIVEGNKERIQVFEGVVLKVTGSGVRASFTVRKISYGVGVERVFLLHSPKIAKIVVVKRAKVRQAYLTYLRALRGKKAKLTEKQFDSLAVNVKEEELKPEDLAPPIPKAEEKGEDLDKEVTELDSEEIADAESAEDLSTEAIADAENSDQAPSEDSVDEQEAPAEEVQEGLDKAEADAEKGESHEGQRAEKVEEEADDQPDEEIDPGSDNKLPR
jgi:large subunit ribosomal protein L19